MTIKNPRTSLQMLFSSKYSDIDILKSAYLYQNQGVHFCLFYLKPYFGLLIEDIGV